MDHDRIVNKRVQRIARDHSCSVADVNAALDHHPIELDRDTFLKRTLAMELVELNELAAGFPGKGSCRPRHCGRCADGQDCRATNRTGQARIDQLMQR